MKQTLTISLVAISFNCFSQPIVSKKYDGKGSNLMVNSIYIDYEKNTAKINMAIYKDDQALQKRNPVYIDIINYYTDTAVFDLQSQIINYMSTDSSFIKKNGAFYVGAQIITKEKLTKAPDTTWINVSKSIKDTTVQRVIGVYSAPDDLYTKTCNIIGVAKFYRDSIYFEEQEVSWTADNKDSVYDVSTSRYIKLYDYFKIIQNRYNLTNKEVIKLGVNHADPEKINDRLKY